MREYEKTVESLGEEDHASERRHEEEIKALTDERDRFAQDHADETDAMLLAMSDALGVRSVDLALALADGEYAVRRLLNRVA